jgi:hypothetical protein
MSIPYLEVDTVEGVVALLKHHPFYGEHVASIRGVQQLGDENVGEAVLDGLPLAPSSNLHHVVAGWPIALRGRRLKGVRRQRRVGQGRGKEEVLEGRREDEVKGDEGYEGWREEGGGTGVRKNEG